ncbi:MAG: OmpA family protein [Elusimicrobia bacterium]|jgi:peptidoglycan-associated lipoprotein|nr:OmpA family protein [Elusimicrobiota bacterium]
MKTFLTVLFGVIISVGCSTRRAPQLDTDQTLSSNQDDSRETASAKEVPSLSVGTEWASVPNLEPAYFVTDRADLTESARLALKRNGVVLKILSKEVPGLEVLVEGHCDERATLEYNMALGERRANAVKKYYETLGIPKKVLSTVSYGEEKPACSRSEESCWHLNRRAVTVVRAKNSIRIPLHKFVM